DAVRREGSGSRANRRPPHRDTSTHTPQPAGRGGSPGRESPSPPRSALQRYEQRDGPGNDLAEDVEPTLAVKPDQLPPRQPQQEQHPAGVEPDEKPDHRPSSPANTN